MVSLIPDSVILTRRTNLHRQFNFIKEYNKVAYMFGPITIAIFDASERKMPFGCKREVNTTSKFRNF